MSPYVRTLWAHCFLLTALLGNVAAEDNESGTTEKFSSQGSASTFFGLTNLWTFHLHIAPADWAAMEPTAPRLMDPRGAHPPAPPPDDAPPFMIPLGGDFERPGGKPLDALLQRPVVIRLNGIEFPMVSAMLDFEGKSYGKIGVRFKGNSSFASSRGSLKRPFKLDFNKFSEGQQFFGMTKLSLNNNAMDPSQIREALGYEIYRACGVPAARTAFAKVFLTVRGKYDHEYVGLYTVVEQIDEHFLHEHFHSDKALLLKPEMGPELSYLGERWEDYKKPYDAKTKGTAAQRQKFIAFTKLLKADGETFRQQISSLMDTDQFLRFLAVTTAEANMDSVLAMGHNFYLLVNPHSEKIQWVPWDLNLAFDQKDLSISRPASGNNRFVPRVLAIPEMNQTYRKHLRSILQTGFVPAKLHADIDAMAQTIRDAVSQDRHVNFQLFERLTSSKGAFSPKGQEELESMRERRGPDFFGPGPRRLEPLTAWVSARAESMDAQLNGKSEGRTLGGMTGPIGGPGGLLGWRMFMSADANGDGKLSRKEFIRLAGTWFDKWDRRQAGSLTRNEVSDGLAEMLGQPPRPGVLRPPRPPFEPPGAEQILVGPRRFGPQFMRAADADGDGELTKRELEGSFGKWFDLWAAKGRDELNPGDVRLGMGAILGRPERIERDLGPVGPPGDIEAR